MKSGILEINLLMNIMIKMDFAWKLVLQKYIQYANAPD